MIKFIKKKGTRPYERAYSLKLYAIQLVLDSFQHRIGGDVVLGHVVKQLFVVGLGLLGLGLFELGLELLELFLFLCDLSLEALDLCCIFSFYYSIIEANEEEFYCDISEKYDAVINSCSYLLTVVWLPLFHSLDLCRRTLLYRRTSPAARSWQGPP